MPDLDVKGFFKKHYKHIINSSISIGIGSLLIFFWSWVLVGIICFIAGYLFMWNRENMKKKKESENDDN